MSSCQFPERERFAKAKSVERQMNKWKEEMIGNLVVLAAYVTYVEEMFTITAQ